jgi:hypothetical protein
VKINKNPGFPYPFREGSVHALAMPGWKSDPTPAVSFKRTLIPCLSMRRSAIAEWSGVELMPINNS